MSSEVIQGDCLEVMRAYPDAHFDAVITDPPYGTTQLAFDQARIDWPAWWAEVHRVTKPHGVIVCFAADLFTVDLIQSNREHYRYRLVWEKSRASGFLDANRRPMKSHEDILVFAQRMKESTYHPQKVEARRTTSSTVKHNQTAHYAKNNPNVAWSDDGTRHPGSVLAFPSVNSKYVLHPTQKPLDLMHWLVRSYTNPGDRVLDPFTGSGSTGAACVELGRAFVGVELDTAYHAIAVARIDAAQPSLFAAD